MKTFLTFILTALLLAPLATTQGAPLDGAIFLGAEQANMVKPGSESAPVNARPSPVLDGDGFPVDQVVQSDAPEAGALSWAVEVPKSGTQEDKGKEKLELVEPELSEKASEAERDRYVREVVFPKVQADATAGRVPAVWEIGYFYLNGWGVPLDLQQAEAGFRAGPESERGRGLWRVGQAYMRTKEFAKAEGLFVESLNAGSKLAARDTALLAQAHLFGLWKLKRNQAKAEALLQQLGEACPDDADYLLGLLNLRYEQKQFAEAHEIATRVAPKLRERPDDYQFARDMRSLCALRSAKLSELTPEKMRELLRNVTDGSTWLLPVALTVLAVALSGLVAWTHLVRKRGPGLALSCAWIGLMSFASGMGFILPLPSALDNAAGRWVGAIMMAVACLIVTRLGGGARYFGAAPLAPDLRSALRTGGLLTALLAGILAINFGYGILYQQVTGRPLESQLVAALLKCITTTDFVITLVVAGLLVPFYEEVIFRGFLFGALERRWDGAWALGVSSVVFAVIHGLTHLPVLLVVALVLGWLRLRTGDLRRSILLHSFNNTLAILLLNVFRP